MQLFQNLLKVQDSHYPIFILILLVILFKTILINLEGHHLRLHHFQFN